MDNPKQFDGLFDDPQRQSPVGVLVEAGYVAYRILKAFWVLLLYFVVKPGGIPAVYLWLGIGVLFTLIGVIGYLNFRNFYFHIDRKRGEFILQRGVLAKKRTAFQLDRIQQVNINQSLLQKITNVYGVEIETAGSSRSEARIRAVSHPVAQALRVRLLSDRGADERVAEDVGGEREQRSPKPFVKISLASLFKVGITSKYLESFFILLAFFFGIYNNIRELLQFDGESENRFDTFLSSFVVLNIIGIVLVVLILLTVMFNLVRIVITYFGFSMRKDPRGLSISYGLVNSRNILLYPQKVQMLVMVSNYFQRKMGLLWMTIRQASAVERRDINSNVQIPGSSVAESEEIMRFVFSRVPERGVALVPNYRKWLTEGLLFLGVPMAVCVGYSWGVGFEWRIVVVMMVYCVPAVVLIALNYRRARLFVNNDFIIQQYGIWDVRTIIIEPYKIQSITVTQFFWQRRANVGHVSIQTASGRLVFRFAEYDRIQQYVNRWLFQVESTDKLWM